MSDSKKKSSFWSIVTIVAAILCTLIALPDSWKPFLPDFLRPSVHLGLDLAGGTQLDFRVSEDEIIARKAKLQEEIDNMKGGGQNKELLAKQFELQNINQQHENLVEAIRNVLERRINSLGVSEATITPSYFGNEKHLLVECPGVIDVNKCIATVGKTIQLEFKEEFSGATLEFENAMRTKANQVYTAVTSGTGNLQVYGEDLSSVLGVTYFDARPLFISSLPKGLESLATATAADPVRKIESTIQATGEDENGQQVLKEIKGIYLAKVLTNRAPAARPLTDPTEVYGELAKSLADAAVTNKDNILITAAPKELAPVLSTIEIGAQETVSLPNGIMGIVALRGRVDGTEQMTASHILIQYKGADRSDATVTRTKDQAQTLIQDIKQKLASGKDFAGLARTLSDGPSKGQAGSLGVIQRGQMVAPFEVAAFALAQGGISDIVETPFGFHIIRADKAPSTSGTKVSYALLQFKGDNDKAKELIAKVEKGEVSRMEDQIVIRGLFFSLEPTGWKDTTLNGRRFRSAAVSFDPVTNIPVVQIQFDDEGGKIFQQLTKRNIGKRIAIFVGGDLVSAPTVQNEIVGGNAVITGSRSIQEAQALAQDLNTGAIPAPIYLSGQSTIEATLGANALKQSITAAAVGLLILCFFLILIYRVLGVIASIALLFYVVLLVASTKLPIGLISGQYVVLTLAGIAGIILSMGMAVDANVLAFERIKEELKKGKMFKTAVETGFQKAWPSVRDGNTSTLITCVILFTVGTSIIRGFAVTLMIGIFISLFTAIIVTRWLCRKLAGSPIVERLEMFGVEKEESQRE
ncbi:protein translocase subunit SecD [Candidatus Peribacteria bacterium]|nr:protein translocase subunit SecD [Candidatus Peribacteria bacterium]